MLPIIQFREPIIQFRQPIYHLDVYYVALDIRVIHQMLDQSGLFHWSAVHLLKCHATVFIQSRKLIESLEPCYSLQATSLQLASHCGLVGKTIYAQSSLDRSNICIDRRRHSSKESHRAIRKCFSAIDTQHADSFVWWGRIIRGCVRSLAYATAVVRSGFLSGYEKQCRRRRYTTSWRGGTQWRWIWITSQKGEILPAWCLQLHSCNFDVSPCLHNIANTIACGKR